MNKREKNDISRIITVLYLILKPIVTKCFTINYDVLLESFKSEVYYNSDCVHLFHFHHLNVILYNI